MLVAYGLKNSFCFCLTVLSLASELVFIVVCDLLDVPQPWKV